MGKIDALHIGHRELAIQASGPPFLLSFVGMAKLLCWELRNDILTSSFGEVYFFFPSYFLLL